MGTIKLRPTTFPPSPSWSASIQKYHCQKCAITYEGARLSSGQPPPCPLCAAEKKVRLSELSMQQLGEQLHNAKQALARIKVQLNDIEAIREALEICGEDDLAWYKSIFYEYRQDKSISIIPAQRGKVLMVVRRGRENETYKPTSPGGAAIAGYCASLDREWGNKQMMSYMLRGLSPKLSGTQQP